MGCFRAATVTAYLTTAPVAGSRWRGANSLPHPQFWLHNRVLCLLVAQIHTNKYRNVKKNRSFGKSHSSCSLDRLGVQFSCSSSLSNSPSLSHKSVKVRNYYVKLEILIRLFNKRPFVLTVSVFIALLPCVGGCNSASWLCDESQHVSWACVIGVLQLK